MHDEAVMTPDQIIPALASQHGLPRQAMMAARDHRGDLVPHFIACLDRIAVSTVDTLTDEDRDACLFVVYLLAEWRETRAYRPLTRLLRQDEDLIDVVIGDALTESASRLVASVFDGDLQPVLDVIDDPAADEFARSAMIEALVIIARTHPSSKPEVVRYLEGFFCRDIPKSEIVWYTWTDAVAELGLDHLEPFVERVYARDLIPPQLSTFDFFRDRLREEGRTGVFGEGQHRQERMPIEDAVDELSRWHCFSSAHAMHEKNRNRALPVISRHLGQTFVREFPKVGRNESCPCGSGRKFKKCCLQ